MSIEKRQDVGLTVCLSSPEHEERLWFSCGNDFMSVPKNGANLVPMRGFACLGATQCGKLGVA